MNMKKIFKTICLTAGILVSTATVTFASQGSTVYGTAGSTRYHGAVDGSVTSSGCCAQTKCYRDRGSSRVYAYVEIVNSGGFKIGNGKQGTGTNYACSGTICHAGGHNAHGSVGTPSGSSRVWCRLR